MPGTATSTPPSPKAEMARRVALLENLREACAPLASLPGLELALHTRAGLAQNLLADAPVPQGEPAATFVADEKTGTNLAVYYSEAVGESAGAMGRMLHLAITGILGKLAVERREEMLLDELGSNWESLEAIYEITADVLRYGDVVEALERLMTRFTSLQNDMQAGMFLTRDGRLKALFGTLAAREPLEWKDLGPLEKPIMQNRSIVINDPGEDPGTAERVPWAGAARVAAAPLTSREKVIGLLVVWRNDTEYEFDAPFSRLLEAITYQASMLLESDRSRRTMRENERLAQEIEIASSIQQTLLFGHPPRSLTCFDIAAFSAASQKIDGDFHDFLKRNDRSVDILIGDVMGKGIAAALLGAATKNQFLRAIANLAIRGQSGGVAPEPAAIVRRAAVRLSDQLIALERFVTLCYARFDLERGTLDFVDCGHTGVLLHRRQSGEGRFLRGDDLPIGVLPDSECIQHSHDLKPGDTYLLFSDGVTETRNTDGDFFGEERLLECVVNWSSLGTGILVDRIRKAAAEFSAHQVQADDFTCIALTVRLDKTRAISMRHTAFACDLAELERMREWVGDAAGEVPEGGLGDDGRQQLELICTEIFVNCVMHGSRGPCSEEVRVSATVYPDHLQVELRHAGPAFDALAVPEPSFDGSRDGGFGTFIIINLADEVFYRREGETNLISISVMRKTRP